VQALMKLLVPVVALLWLNDPVKRVHAGEAVLTCFFESGGWREVPPEKVVGLVDARWVFVNGSASNCRLD